ncbi:MAG: hypothetical protein AB8F78_09115 [Saprospiraceae bacterium]
MNKFFSKLKRVLWNESVVVSNSQNVSIDQRTFNHPEFITRGVLDWKLQDETFGEKYFQNNKIREIIKSVSDSILKQEPSIIQILGLAGLGKTRLIYECVSSLTNFKKEIYYCNAASQEDGILRHLLRLVNEQNDGVLIVDNCDSTTFNILVSEIPRTTSLLNLVVISKDVSSRHAELKKIEQHELRPEHFQQDIIPEMIRHYYPQLPPADVEKISLFSQGFPMIARLLADARGRGSDNIGELTDDELLKKLVGIEESDDEDAYHVLRACSLFEKLGNSHDMETHKDFVANNSRISRLTGPNSIIQFENKCSIFLKRGILEQQGRYLTVRPKPLAIRLAADWWRDCIARGHEFKIIEEITKQGLGEELCNQIAMLDFLPEAQKLTEDLCGPQAPFGRAEVLNSKEGSRLFRSLAEVNPQVASDTLFFHYGDADIDTLKNVREGRRQFVWTLEKLCFREDTFEKSAKVLLNFAAAENENISNNATGQFIGLYQLILPGTSVNLATRFKTIQYAMSKNNPEYGKIALFSIQRSLGSAKGSSRMMGAENSGSSPKLPDHHPTKEEVKTYYLSILSIIEEQICKNLDLHQEAKKILGVSINTIFDNGFEDLAIEYTNKILDFDDIFWREAFISTIHLYNFTKGNYSDKMREKILNLAIRLRPTKFVDQYQTIVKSPLRWNLSSFKNSQELLSEGQNYSDILESNVSMLLAQHSSQVLDWNIAILFEDRQQNGTYFGSELGKKLLTKTDDTYSTFLDKLLNFIREHEEDVKDASVLAGYIAIATETRHATLDNLVKSKLPLTHLIAIARYCEPTTVQLSNWIETYSSSDQSLSPFNALSYSKSLDHLDLNEIILLCIKISTHTLEGAYVAFNILSSNIKIGDPIWNQAKGPIKQIIMTDGFISNIDNLGRGIDLNFRSYITELLQEYDESLLIHIKNEVIHNISESGTLAHYSETERLLNTLITDHFEIIWEDLGKLILEDPNIRIIAKFHLGVREGSMYTKGSLFSNENNLQTLFTWCKNNSPLAAQIICGIMPTSTLNDSGEKAWHPFALKMINEFGSDKKLLAQLHANLNSYSTIGSLVPYLESKINLVRELKSHKTKEVRIWASIFESELSQDIENETLRDEEWGMN